MFQATICGGVQGHARDQYITRPWVLFPVILAGRFMSRERVGDKIMITVGMFARLIPRRKLEGDST